MLGGVFEVENGFWVLFATLSVVRTSAPMTGASAFQAVFGTVIGFAIALPLLLAIGTREDLYLLVLPIVTVGGLLAGSLNVVWGRRASRCSSWSSSTWSTRSAGRSGSSASRTSRSAPRWAC